METPAVAEVNIFDFDDTLVKTKSHIYLTTRDGRSVKMTPAEYAVYDPQTGDEFDFSDFQQVVGPQPINHMILKLQYAIRNLGHDNVFILTARGSAEPIERFLNSVGVSGIRIVALGDSNPQRKADVIRDEIVERGVRLIKFYDDSMKNIVAVRDLRRDPAIPREVQIIATRIK
jgi:phosphoglycolate phosphatase-like HAD superfamily hydrolase